MASGGADLVLAGGVAAQASGRFADEIVPVSVTDRKGRTTVLDTNGHPRLVLIF